jgi:two-component system nitrogen regulation response regulator GlnG
MAYHQFHQGIMFRHLPVQSGLDVEYSAHALHKHSPRRAKPFIALNMAAIPKDLIETELFGV